MRRKELEEPQLTQEPSAPFRGMLAEMSGMQASWSRERAQREHLCIQ